MTTTSASTRPRRSAKSDPEALNAAARQRLLTAHADPRFNLAVEPWIPVILADGSVGSVGLAGVLSLAHQIRDLAEPHPLVRAGLRRLLSGLAVDLVRRSNLDSDEWMDLVDDRTGFPAGALNATLDAHADHWWLWHPRTPFLQDQRLVSALVEADGATIPIQEIIPDLPSKNTSTWFVKPGEPACTAPVTAPDAARWLVARWFYGLPGNCGHISVPNSATSVSSQAGGTFVESIATVTHAWRVSPGSLFTTLLRNIPAALLVDPDDECAWLDAQRPSGSPGPLYLATLACTATLLAVRDDTGHVTGVVRGPLPCDKDRVKQLQKAAVVADQHRVITQKITNGERRAVRLDPDQRIEALRQFYRDGLEAATLRGVVNSADLWLPKLPPANLADEQIELLLAKKNGTGSSPGWNEVVTFLLPAGYLDPEHSRFDQVRSAVAAAFHPRNGIHRQLQTATRRLLAPAKHNDPTVEGMTRTVQERWLTSAATLLTQALDGEIEPDHGWRVALQRHACNAFREVFAVYTASTRYAAPFAIALAHLRSPRSTS